MLDIAVTEDELIETAGLDIVEVGRFPVNMLGGVAYLVIKDGDRYYGIAQFGGRVQGKTFRASGYGVAEAWGNTPETVLGRLKETYQN